MYLTFGNGWGASDDHRSLERSAEVIGGHQELFRNNFGFKRARMPQMVSMCLSRCDAIFLT